MVKDDRSRLAEREWPFLSLLTSHDSLLFPLSGLLGLRFFPPAAGHLPMSVLDPPCFVSLLPQRGLPPLRQCPCSTARRLACFALHAGAS
jgi:hypothetical protein